jgi:hypothetical protein
MYSKVKTDTEKYSKIQKKAIYLDSSDFIVSKITAMIFRQIKLVIKTSNTLLALSCSVAFSRISYTQTLTPRLIIFSPDNFEFIPQEQQISPPQFAPFGLDLDLLSKFVNNKCRKMTTENLKYSVSIIR